MNTSPVVLHRPMSPLPSLKIKFENLGIAPFLLSFPFLYYPKIYSGDKDSYIQFFRSGSKQMELCLPGILLVNRIWAIVFKQRSVKSYHNSIKYYCRSYPFDRNPF